MNTNHDALMPLGSVSEDTKGERDFTESDGGQFYLREPHFAI